MKSITPVVSVILLIMLTIVASAGAYFFITSSVTDMQSSGAIEGSPYADNSRLNLVSITGSQALVRNEGTSPVTEMVILINGQLLNYTLDTPIQPGEIRAINYTSQLAGLDLEIKIIYNQGKIEKDISSAIRNNENSGFDSTPNIFFDSCGEGNTIVDWNNNFYFQLSDNITCGCDSNLGINYLNNSGFELGLDSWEYYVPVPAEQSVIINDSIVNSGNYSLMITSANSNPANQVYAKQQVSINSSSLSVSFFFNASVSTFGFAAMIVNFNLDNEVYSIYYTPIQVGLDEYCELGRINENSMLKCFDEFSLNNWNNLTVYPYDDGMSFFLKDFSNTLTDVGFISAGFTTAFFDDITIFESSRGKYCDSDNFGGTAQGICYEDQCINTYIKPYISRVDFLTSESPYIYAELDNFNPDASCILSNGTINYPMNVNSTSASYTFSSLPKGDYSFNISCGFNQSKIINVSSQIMRQVWSYNAKGNNMHSTPLVLGEFILSNSNQEIIVRNYTSILIFDANGTILGELDANKFVLDAPGGLTFQPLRLADFNNDGNNELFIQTHEYFYIFNSSLDLLLNVTVLGYDLPSPAIFEINSSKQGPEILTMKGGTTLSVFSSQGEQLWEHFTSGNGWSCTDYFGAVVSEINPSNPGLEIVRSSETSNGVIMLSSNGSVLGSYLTGYPNGGLMILSAVGNVTSDAGNETAAILTYTDTNSLTLLNSNFEEIWSYNISNNFSYFSPVMGDLTGEGNKEIIVYGENKSGRPDVLYIFNGNGTLLTESYLLDKDNYLVLGDFDSSDLGFEILAISYAGIYVLNEYAEVLYFYPKVSPGENYATGDVNNDGMMDVVFATENTLYFFTTESVSNKYWPTFKQNNANTGCIE